MAFEGIPLAPVAPKKAPPAGEGTRQAEREVGYVCIRRFSGRTQTLRRQTAPWQELFLRYCAKLFAPGERQLLPGLRAIIKQS